MSARFINFNNAWLNYRGRTLEEEYGFGWADGVHQDDYEICLDIFINAFDAQEAFSMDYRLQKKDGSYGWIRDDGEPYFDESGVFKGYVGSCFEISDTKALVDKLERNQQELIEREKTLQDIMDCSPAVVFVKDLEGKYLFVDQRYLSNLNLSKQDVIGKTDLDFLPKETAMAVRDNDLKVIHSNKHLVMEEQIPLLDGIRLYTSEKFPLVDSQGEVYAICGISTDITERRRQELQLRQSQKMEAIGQLAGGVAHDFNNQLASIMGFAELIEFTDDIQDVKKHIKKIISAAEHSGNLTSQLLAFSRKEDLRQEAIDIHELIHQTIELLEHVIDKRIEIQTDLNGKECTVIGDNSLVQNALLNLGLNARDAMPDGGLITISTKNLESLETELIEGVPNSKPTPFIQIDVNDTGRGIPEQEIPRICEPFYTTKESGKGTGLGLASVYGTIENMGGFIQVESQVGVGTHFKVCLPLADSPEIQDTTPNAQKTGNQSQSKIILIADDEPLIRDMCGEFLNLLGHQVLFAKDGVEATELYAKHWKQIDLVLLDMVMPAMNGKEAFHKMKQLNPAVKVIMSSGFTAESSSAELISDGVLKVMRKPFKLSELKRSIEEFSELED